MSQRLILFTRYPEPGKTKTRMIPCLGAEGAAALHRQLTQHMLRELRQFQGLYPSEIEIHFSGGSAAQAAAWLGPPWHCVPQAEGDLGDRLLTAFRQSFISGMERVVIIGSDCPSLTPQHLIEAFHHLKSHEVVLGPARDGGYYLIGLQRLVPELFRNIAWGTDRVFEQTQQAAAQSSLSVSTLDCLNDVDRPEDLNIWERVRRDRPMS